MKTSYCLSQVLGSVFEGGNICFDASGDCLFSPIGNQIQCFDLKNNLSFTFDIQMTQNITHLACSSNGLFLIVVDLGI